MTARCATFREGNSDLPSAKHISTTTTSGNVMKTVYVVHSAFAEEGECALASRRLDGIVEEVSRIAERHRQGPRGLALIRQAVLGGLIGSHDAVGFYANRLTSAAAEAANDQLTALQAYLGTLAAYNAGPVGRGELAQMAQARALANGGSLGRGSWQDTHLVGTPAQFSVLSLEGHRVRYVGTEEEWEGRTLGERAVAIEARLREGEHPVNLVSLTALLPHRCCLGAQDSTFAFAPADDGIVTYEVTIKYRSIPTRGETHIRGILPRCTEPALRVALKDGVDRSPIPLTVHNAIQYI